MCRFIPTEEVSSFPQLGHRHLYTPRKELCGDRRRRRSAAVGRAQSGTRRSTSSAHFGLFGAVLVSLLRLHVQAFVGTAVHLGDRRRGSRAAAAVIPAPVAAAAAVGELAAATLHVGRRRGASWGKQRDSRLKAGHGGRFYPSVRLRINLLPAA